MKIEEGILDGKAVAAEIRAEVAERVKRITDRGARPPGLTVVLVGDDPASKVYVGMKAKACEQAGIVAHTEVMAEETSEAELLSRLEALNNDDTVDGILVQLPLPDHISEARVLVAIDPAKDVDGFHPLNVGRLWLGEKTLAPATPSGIIGMLKRYQIPLEGARAVVVGRSNIVGKPMASLLIREHATVTVCHSRTRDLPAVCREADLLITALGRPALIGPDHIREGAVVVDVGTNRIDERAEVERLFPDDADRLTRFDQKGFTLVGDVDFTRVRPKARAITPVPGGVGPLTVAYLLVNTLEASLQRQGIDAPGLA